jgi:hypothetical protein
MLLPHDLAQQIADTFNNQNQLVVSYAAAKVLEHGD